MTSPRSDTLFETFPVRLLGRAVFPLTAISDPVASARLGWRAPVFAYVGLERGMKIEPGFAYIAPLLDVTGAARGTQKISWDGCGHRPAANDGSAASWEKVLELGTFSEGDVATVRWHLGRAHLPGQGQAAFAAVCVAMDRYTDFDSDHTWQRFLTALEKDRFEANVWFERDRRNLSLRDTVMGVDVFSLWDEDVDEAIEGGFIRPPRHPRPSDADWLPTLMDYAESQGMVMSLRQEQRPAQRQAERQGA